MLGLDAVHPCRCLCFEFSQITRTTPLRWMTLHLSQIFFTDARTFISFVASGQLPVAPSFARPDSRGRLSLRVTCIDTRFVRGSGRRAKVPPLPYLPEEYG